MKMCDILNEVSEETSKFGILLFCYENIASNERTHFLCGNGLAVNFFDISQTLLINSFKNKSI